MSTPTDTKDGGFASRKLLYASLTSLGVFVSGCVAAYWPAFQPSLDTVIGGLIGVFVAYSGANVANKLVVGKNLKALAATKTEDPLPGQPVEQDPEQQ